MARVLKLSTGLKNYVMETGSLLDALNTLGAGGASGCEIRLYGSATPISIPASPNDAITGAKYCTIKNGGDYIEWEVDTDNGTTVRKKSAETWSGTVTTATNVRLYYFRIVCAAAEDGDDASTTDKRIQGSIGDRAAEFDMYMLNPDVNTSDVKTLSAFDLSILDA